MGIGTRKSPTTRPGNTAGSTAFWPLRLFLTALGRFKGVFFYVFGFRACEITHCIDATLTNRKRSSDRRASKVGLWSRESRVESRESRVERPETRDQRPETRVQSPESRGESPEARGEGRGARGGQFSVELGRGRAGIQVSMSPDAPPMATLSQGCCGGIRGRPFPFAPMRGRTRRSLAFRAFPKALDFPGQGVRKSSCIKRK